MNIKILGSGCPNCKKLEENVNNAVAELGLDATVEKITDMNVIMGYGVMSTPTLLVDGQVVSYGYVPNVKDIKEMLNNPGSQIKSKKGCCSCGGNC